MTTLDMILAALIVVAFGAGYVMGRGGKNKLMAQVEADVKEEAAKVAGK